MTTQDRLDRLTQLYAIKEDVGRISQSEETQSLLSAIRISIASFEDIGDTQMRELISEIRNKYLSIIAKRPARPIG